MTFSVSHKETRRAVASRHRFSLLSGFTLIELLVTITLIAVLFALAAPSLSDAALGSKLSANTNRLGASAVLARSEAIKRNVSITLCMSANGTSCITTGGWEQGWILLTSGSPETVLLYERAAPTGLKITESSSLASMIFQATGVGSTQATFTVCQATPSIGNQERVISIIATGRTSVKRRTAGICT